MNFKKILSMGALVSTLITQSCHIHALDLIFKPDGCSESRDAYIMTEIDKKGEEHFLFGFSLFYLGSPFSDIILENREHKFRLKITGNQLNKLKRTIRLLNDFQKQRDQLSWGEKYTKLHTLSNIQHKKLLKYLEDVFMQNHYISHYTK